MQRFEESADHFGVSAVLAVVLAEFASVAVEIPLLGDLGCNEFDDNVERLYAR